MSIPYQEQVLVVCGKDPAMGEWGKSVKFDPPVLYSY